MNKLDIKLGGHPFTGDDLLFIQNNLQEALTALAAMHGQDLVVISGVQISTVGLNTVWTAGWIYLNGELCKVDAGLAATATNNTFVIDETYDPLGNKQYEDLNIEDTFIIRKAIIQGTAGGTNAIANIKRMQMNALESPRNISALVSFTWIAVGGAQFRKNQINEVILSGQVSAPVYDSATQQTMVILPVGYRPSALDSVFITTGSVNGVDKPIFVNINGLGEISISGIVDNDNVVVNLTGLRFIIGTI